MVFLQTVCRDCAQVSKLPRDLFQPCRTSLRRIYLHTNVLTSLERSLFDGLSDLAFVTLYNNRITALYENTFATTGNLRLLNVNDNAVTQLTQGVFKGLGQLHTLSMARNKLTELQQGVFSLLTALINLHLEGNGIIRVDVGAFPSSTASNAFSLAYQVVTNSQQLRLRTLSMRFNPSQCWSGIKDYASLSLANDTVSIRDDFRVTCKCARGYFPAQTGGQDDGATCIKKQCPARPTLTAAMEKRIATPACPGNAFQDRCTLRCKPGFGAGQVTYTCSANGEWVSEDRLFCSGSNSVQVKPIVLGEQFRFRVPPQLQRIGFDFEGGNYETKVCVEQQIEGGELNPTMYKDEEDGTTSILVTVNYFNNSGILLTNQTQAPAEGYVTHPDSVCSQLFSRQRLVDTGGVGIEFNMVLDFHAIGGKTELECGNVVGGKWELGKGPLHCRQKFMYNQRLEVFPRRYEDNIVAIVNASVTSGKAMVPLGLPPSAQVKGFGSFPVQVYYSNNSALPAGVVLNTETGVLSGIPVTNSKSMERITFEIVGRDQGSLSSHRGLKAAVCTFDVFPTLRYGGDIQVVTIGQYYQGTSPTVQGGKAPVRYSIKNPAALPPGLSVDKTNGMVTGSPTQAFLSAEPAVVVATDANNAQQELRGVRFQVKLPVLVRFAAKGGRRNRLPTGVISRKYNATSPMIEWRRESGDAVPADLTPAAGDAAKGAQGAESSGFNGSAGLATPVFGATAGLRHCFYEDGSCSKPDSTLCEQLAKASTAVPVASTISCADGCYAVTNPFEDCALLAANVAVSSALKLGQCHDAMQGAGPNGMTQMLKITCSDRASSGTRARRISRPGPQPDRSSSSYTDDEDTSTLNGNRRPCANCSVLAPPLKINGDAFEGYDVALASLVFSAEGLPGGLIIDSTTAQIVGVPERSGQYNVSIFFELAMQRNSQNRLKVNSADFSLDVLECGDSTEADDGNAGEPTCFNGGRCNSGESRFDDVFSCECGGAYTGDLCASRTDSGSDAALAVGVSIGVIIFLLSGILFSVAYWRYQLYLEHQKPIDFVQYWQNFQSKAPELKIDTKRKTPKEIPRRLISIEQRIGQGAFGEVHKGNYNVQNSTGLVGIEVAIKKAKLDLNVEHNEIEHQSAFVDLIQEAALMAQFDHPNILSLVGVCTKGIADGQPLLLIISFCALGNLIDFLAPDKDTGRSSVKIRDKLRICQEVAQGMVYLSDKNYVHRDLAARNVLVDSEFVCKISDFGLSRDIGGDEAAQYYRTSGAGALPVRWTALEALEDHKFTTFSDVWSFGILAVEIFSNCQTPYYGMKNHDVWLNLRAGMRHERPDGCPKDIYKKVMRDCWTENPLLRPRFETLVERLESLAEKNWDAEDKAARKIRSTTTRRASTATGSKSNNTGNSATTDISAQYVNATVVRAVAMLAKEVNSRSSRGRLSAFSNSGATSNGDNPVWSADSPQGGAPGSGVRRSGSAAQLYPVSGGIETVGRQCACLIFAVGVELALFLHHDLCTALCSWQGAFHHTRKSAHICSVALGARARVGVFASSRSHQAHRLPRAPL